MEEMVRKDKKWKDKLILSFLDEIKKNLTLFILMNAQKVDENTELCTYIN